MYRHRNSLPLASAAPALVVALALSFLPFAGWTDTAVGAEQAAIAIDADPTDNTANSLGAIDTCIEVSPDATFDVDFVITNTVDLLAWETYVTYDESVLEVVDRDVGMFLATGPERDVFDASENVPDGDGVYRLTAADIASPPYSHTGSGVLARLTFTAVDQGVTLVSAAPIDRNQDGMPDVGPVFKDLDNSLIGDSNGDSFFDGPTADARVAVDASCSAIAGAGLLEGGPLAAGGSGGAWWIVTLVAGVGAVSLTAAGTLWARRVRAGPAGGS
jgi:hypothetical protein